MNQNNQGQTLKQKLMAVQKHFKTFAIEEESAKKKNDGSSQYKYTPGWKIVESIRSMLDDLDIMLTLNNVTMKNTMLIYPVYKDFKGKLVKFEKGEILCELEGDYTFEDVNTGETAGPYHYTSAGANGIDKSCATAYSLLERYFLLKHFHITTREIDDEPDAHDSDIVPGMETCGAPTGRTDFDGNIQPYCQAQSPYPAQLPLGQILPQPFQQPYYPGQQMQPVYPQSAQPRQHDSRRQPMPGSAPIASERAIIASKYANHPDVNKVIEDLSNFETGTPTALQMLNNALTRLAQNGYNCTTDPNFIGYITETAQARREGRMPNYT